MPRCARGESAAADTVPAVAWQLWLAAPIGVTLIAGIVLWWRARPRPEPPIHRRVRDHRRFLDDLDRHATLGRDAPQSVSALDRPADAAPPEQPEQHGAEVAPGPPG